MKIELEHGSVEVEIIDIPKESIQAQKLGETKMVELTIKGPSSASVVSFRFQDAEQIADAILDAVANSQTVYPDETEKPYEYLEEFQSVAEDIDKLIQDAPSLIVNDNGCALCMSEDGKTIAEICGRDLVFALSYMMGVDFEDA